MFHRVQFQDFGYYFDSHLRLDEINLRVGWQIGIFISNHDDDSLGSVTPFKLAVGTEVSTSRAHAVFAIKCHTDSLKTGFLSVTCAPYGIDRFPSLFAFILSTCKRKERRTVNA
jgi:hypothetical protein